MAAGAGASLLSQRSFFGACAAHTSRVFVCCLWLSGLCLGSASSSLQAEPIHSVAGHGSCPTEISALWQQLWLLPGHVVTGPVNDVSTYVQGMLVRLDVVHMPARVVIGCKGSPPSLNVVLTDPLAQPGDAETEDAWTASGFKGHLLSETAVLAKVLDREELLLEHWFSKGLWNSLGPSAAGIKLPDDQRTSTALPALATQPDKRLGA